MSMQVGISGFDVACEVHSKDNLFIVQKQRAWPKFLADPQVTVTGETAGELNRRWLHEQLDTWLETK